MFELKRLANWLRRVLRKPSPLRAPTAGVNLISKSRHHLSRTGISSNALKVLNRLQQEGFAAYLVGGGVRDLLLQRLPKDFDVATNARPEEIQQLFRNCRLIGRRFRLAHVFFGREIIEVSTFRRGAPVDESDGHDHKVHSTEGMILRDNVYGSLEEDVWRRDLTINALYLDTSTSTLHDYVGGWEDISAKIIRMIGEPSVRYREDPVRMLRTIRFAAKLGFSIHPDTEAPLYDHGELMHHVPPARLFEEYLKLFLSGYALATYRLLTQYQLFERLFPSIKPSLHADQEGLFARLIEVALINTDSRVNQDKGVAPSFLLAIFLWQAVREHTEHQLKLGLAQYMAVSNAMETVLQEQAQNVAIPKRFSLVMREIWSLQWRLERRAGRRAAQLYAHPRFRAAYDFLVLRAEAGDQEVTLLSHWWTEYIHQNSETRNFMATQVAEALPKKKRRRRRKPAGLTPGPNPVVKFE